MQGRIARAKCRRNALLAKCSRHASSPCAIGRGDKGAAGVNAVGESFGNSTADKGEFFLRRFEETLLGRFLCGALYFELIYDCLNGRLSRLRLR